MVRAFLHVVRRDLSLALRQGSDSLMVLGFFVVAVVLFPLGIGPEPQLLARIAPGILWVSALLSAMLSLDRLFQTDYEDGSLEQMVLAPAPLEFTVIAKVVSHWLTTGLPMLINTSFNLRGEPIVCTPEDAISTFQRSRMDALVLGNLVVERGAP